MEINQKVADFTLETDEGKTVTTTLIPSGAVNPVANDTAVDENAVKPQVRKPLPLRQHPKQKKQ